MRNILLIGGPGSGKGTLGTFFQETLGAFHLSTGELFRENIKNDTEIGQKVKAAIEAGGLADDKITSEMMAKKMDDLIDENNENISFVFDGFPRNIEQGPILDELLGEFERELDIVFYLIAPDDVMLERLAERATKEDRPEDADPEYCAKRLAVFHERTTPLVDFYREKGILVEIDATESIGEIRLKVIKELIKVQ